MVQTRCSRQHFTVPFVQETGSSGSAQPSSDEDETLQPFESRPRSDSTGAQLPPVSSQISVSSNGSAITQEAENGNTRGAAIRKDVKGTRSLS